MLMFAARSLLAAILTVTTAAHAALLVASGADDSVFRFDVPSGSPGTQFVGSGSGGLNNTRGIAVGPDGNVYVTGNIGGTEGHVFRYSGTTGAFLGLFATTVDANPFGIAFGPDGNLYVANITSDSVSRFNGTTGALIGSFVVPGAGGLDAPRGIVFGPDGNLYVSSADSNRVLRYSGTSGAFVNVFATADARGLAFGPDGNLYVASFNDDAILRFNGITGAAMGIFATGNGLDGPVGLAFGDGGLFVSSFNNGLILEFDPSSGAFVKSIGTLAVSAAEGGSGPRLMAFTTREPGTVTLLGLALVGLAVSRRRPRRP